MKAGVHGALGTLALVCFGYNVWAWTIRRDAHLAANVLIYAAITTLEARKFAHHVCDS